MTSEKMGPNPIPSRGIRRRIAVLHRTLGLVLGPLVALWFVSGIGMMYTGGMPSLTPDLRLERLPSLELTAVRQGPAEAYTRTGLNGAPSSVTLLSVLGRPAYRFNGSQGPSVFADDTTLVETAGTREAVWVASLFAGVPVEAVTYDQLISHADQWTIAQRRQLPLHRLRVDDGRGTVLYVSPGNAEVVQITTRRSRALAWIAAIPHWLYLTPLRLREGLWRQLILWTAGIGSVLAVLGLTLAVVQFRVPRPVRLSHVRSYIPYAGWMRWHYLTGAVFGVLTFTWIFSGFLSMEPWGWASGEGLSSVPIRRALAGEAVALEAIPSLQPAALAAFLGEERLKEVSFGRVRGHPTLILRTSADQGIQGVSILDRGSPRSAGRHILDALSLRPITSIPMDTLLGIVRATYPEIPIADAAVLHDYDSYYYSRDRSAPLPVLRVRFDDADRTWMYLDPEAGTVAAALHRLDRIERWIYSGFHSLDFNFWYRTRPAWDIAMIVLLLGGLTTTVIGFSLGLERIARKW
ncbi:MAG: PepSY domain-containing protein [Gemmatimonadota bacterium]